MDKNNEKWFSNQLNDVLKYKILPITPLERLFLLALASYADKKGYCFPSLKQISDYVGMERKNVPRYLKQLKNKKIITIKRNFIRGTKRMKTNTYVINIKAIIELSVNEKGETEITNCTQLEDTKITKCHQPEDTKIFIEKAEKTKKANLVSSARGQGCSLLEDTLKSNPNANQEEPKDIVQPKTLDAIFHLSHDSMFEEFWRAYPRKERKKAAHRIWVRDKLDRNAHEIIQDVHDRQVRHDRWEDKAYIPLPTSYLNNESWNDEITERTYGTHKKVSKQSDISARIIEFTNDYAESRKRNGI
jgi:hypothetical protein